MSINTKLEQLNTKIESGKTLLATAITKKGVSTEKTETLEAMAGKIEQISQSGGGGLEPGSTIPVDMLQPPTETGLLPATSKTTPTNFVVHTDTHILFTNSYYGYLKSFDKTTKQIKTELNGYSEFLTCIKTSEGNFLLFCKHNSSKVVIVINSTFNVLLEKELTGIPTSFTIVTVEMGDSYYLLVGSTTASNNILYKIDKSNLEFTSSTINSITGNSNRYYYNMIAYENHLFILGQNDFIKIDSNMTMVNSSTSIKANSTDKKYFNVYANEGFIYMLPYNFMNSKIFKINPSDLTFTEELFKGIDGTPKISCIDNYFIIYGDKKFNIYGLDLSFKKTITLNNNFNSVSIIDNYILIEDTTQNIYLYDIINDFELKWNLPYSKDVTYIGSNSYMIDFGTNYRFAYLNDGKIYLFRCGVYSINVEPVYTIKAETLMSLPAVVPYLMSIQKNKD